MELVEGPTLADRIAQGAIPIDDALPIAKQISEALEAAHEAWVIHRDLKPANIKVREDGTVKVLDFGLAKALDPSPDADPSQSPTLTAAATQMGVIMGTAAYMSPEQARGSVADHRADIWSFGVVLYELLTGRRLFEGATVSDTLAAVLRADPDWGALPATAPSALRRLLRRCLERDRKERLQHIGDARVELREASAPLSSDAVPPPIPFSGVRDGRRQVYLRPLDDLEALPVPGVRVADEVSFFSTSDQGGLTYRTAAESALTQLRLLDRTGTELRTVGPPGDYQNPVLSRDEARVAVERDGDIRLLDLMRETDQRFTFASGPELFPTWSPDGDRLLFVSFRDTGQGIYEKETAGTSPPQLLLETNTLSVLTDWSPDGEVVSYHDFTESFDLWLLPMSEEGQPTSFLSMPFNEAWGVSSPDGRWLAYASDEAGEWRVYLRSVSGGGQWQISAGFGGRPDPIQTVAPSAQRLRRDPRWPTIPGRRRRFFECPDYLGRQLGGGIGPLTNASHPRHHPRPLFRHRQDRRRRHGRGVSGPRHQARPRCRTEGAARGVHGGPRPAGPLRAGS